MQKHTKSIIDSLGFEYEILENAKDVEAVQAKYLSLLKQGKLEGFTPLIILPSEDMAAILAEFSSSKANVSYSFEIALSESKNVDVDKFLDERLSDYMEGEDMEEEIDEDIDTDSNNVFLSVFDYSTNEVYPELIFSKIPTSNPWELPAYVPMGGYNDCPLPEEQVAVFKTWHDKYGAIPAVVSFDIWELYVENPIVDENEALLVATSHFAFCCDIVWQGVQTVGALAKTIVDSKVWFFWWD